MGSSKSAKKTNSEKPTMDKFPDENGIEVWYMPPIRTRPTADIVFIHGLTGGRNSTWTAEGATRPWPLQFLAEEKNDDKEKGPPPVSTSPSTFTPD
ncbi:hypothetical protein B0J14DRAFT_654597 [Halenospora varia]|nr:hypothetical protein B0J14DRAFT_654597 [Halenospora varia]